ncbi:hypothetical protein MAF45_05940 [Mesosutterella sp. OilRF-GAM-744-9]|uniref:Uncharacterized protein n=1 Tax=Mesosutterella porci TaxID=2915351 RepID=A0ABS9MQT1_9BURK|nr:hypothetical protein [Mesosutterella sp. oilRF-744-WT-GAM-9]MCG5030987.1 hypothetical protein [Mesosutterella sp. oilRF-744-WT-GAM-9]
MGGLIPAQEAGNAAGGSESGRFFQRPEPAPKEFLFYCSAAFSEAFLFFGLWWQAFVIFLTNHGFASHRIPRRRLNAVCIFRLL